MNLTPRLALLLSALMALGGCNVVMTDAPMFTAADGAGAPAIRSGVWRDDKPDCAFDETLPQSKWPKCAEARPGVADPPFWLPVTGDPAILQMPMRTDDKKPGPQYFYAAFRPLKRDARGRVIAMKAWPVRCGPPPPPDAAPPPPPAGAAGDKQAQAAWADLGANVAALGGTNAPLPGLAMRSDGETCVPASVAALRDAAKASEAWAEAPATSHWVREPRRGDAPLLTPAMAQQMTKTPS